MAVRVVLEFDDEEGAKAFVKSTILDGCVYGDRVSDYPEDDRASYLMKVIGVFKKPTKYCDPNDGHRRGKTSSAWTRGKKYGWWVCAVCGKPTEKWATGRLWQYSMGFNLLPHKFFPWSKPEGGWAAGAVQWTEEELGLEAGRATEEA